MKRAASETGAMTPDDQGREVFIAVKIGYPGSRVSDVILPDGQVVKVKNEHLFAED